MTERIRPTSLYRGFNIAVNPSGKAKDARTDAFSIFEPGAHPMNTVTLHEYPGKVEYNTEAEAHDAAMAKAREWIDAHLK